MNLHSINSITEYNNFLKHLNPYGLFQKKLLLISIVFWIIAGLLRTISDKNIFAIKDFQQQYPFLQYIPSLFMIIGLFIGPYLAIYYNRKTLMLIQSIIFTIGSILLLISSIWTIEVLMYLSICMIQLTYFAICFSAMCIFFEYIQTTQIPKYAGVFLFLYHLGKLILLIIFVIVKNEDIQTNKLNMNQNNQDNQDRMIQIILSSLIIFFSILYLIGSYLYKQSLRFLIDNDIQQAQRLALQISQQNDCPDDKILNFIQGSFIWNKVNIKKYNLSCLIRYKSLARQTYYVGFAFFFMGIFSKFALVLFYEQNIQRQNAIFQDDIKLMYMSIFQVIGFIPICNVYIYLYLYIYIVLGYSIFTRKQVTLISSILTTLLSFILLIIIKSSQISNIRTLISIYSLLGINNFLQSILFSFLFLQCIQYYPHTIRTLGLCICVGFYFIGQLIFQLHIDFVMNQQTAVELVFSCCVIMVIHITKVKETFNKGIHYQIKQIEERQNIQD